MSRQDKTRINLSNSTEVGVESDKDSYAREPTPLHDHSSNIVCQDMSVVKSTDPKVIGKHIKELLTQDEFAMFQAAFHLTLETGRRQLFCVARNGEHHLIQLTRREKDILVQRARTDNATEGEIERFFRQGVWNDRRFG